MKPFVRCGLLLAIAGTWSIAAEAGENLANILAAHRGVVDLVDGRFDGIRVEYIVHVVFLSTLKAWSRGLIAAGVFRA